MKRYQPAMLSGHRERGGPQQGSILMRRVAFSAITTTKGASVAEKAYSREDESEAEMHRQEAYAAFQGAGGERLLGR